MGIFTNQVERLATEQKTARQRTEEKERERKQLTQTKQDIYFYFLRCFEDSDNIYNTYIELMNPARKHKTINFYLNNEKHYFDIDIQYNNLLNKAKSNFEIYNKELEKREAEQLKEYLEEIKRKNYEETRKSIYKDRENEIKKHPIAYKILFKLGYKY